jgi:triacylglycerol lipase
MSWLSITRRKTLLGLAAALLTAGCVTTPSTSSLPAIVFVHGNGDSAAQWTTTLWRFESNGWPRQKLHAIDLPNPSARDDDTVEQPGRSSAADHARFLAAEVEQVLHRTGAAKVVLVASSRGGIAVRNYVQNLGGAAKVSHAVLGGTPNHGVWNNPGFRPNNEFNGSGPVLTALNAPKGPNGDEVTPGVKWMTIRSDNNDKFAQPDGVWIGARGTPTNVNADGPALKGAKNVVLAARDHREVAFHAEAFAATFEFITGRAPGITSITSTPQVVLDGQVSGIGPGGATNLPLVGATLEVFAVDASTGERRGAALHSKTIGADGRWGPFQGDSRTAYEFVVSASGYAHTHVYRSPFPRSSDIVHLRAMRLAAADKEAVAVVHFTRPRGYFGVPRDRVVFDGFSPPPGVPNGVAGVASSTLKLKEGAGRTVIAEFSSGPINERLVGTAWPTAQDHVTVLELHH